ITSAITLIDGSFSTSSTLVVSTPSGAGQPRSLPRSRTSALTTRSRCPVARSMSSACSFSRRLTAAPTVPYPSSATGTSTDAMRLRHLAPPERAQALADLLDLGVGELRARLGKRRRAAVHLCDPLARERAVLDVLQDLAHVLAHVLVDDARPHG